MAGFGSGTHPWTNHCGPPGVICLTCGGGWGLPEEGRRGILSRRSGSHPRPRIAAAMETSQALGPRREALWPGGLKSVSSASERRSGPSPPAPHLSGFYYFLVPGIYLTSKKNTTVTCTCRIFNQYTTVHVKKHIAL